MKGETAALSDIIILLALRVEADTTEQRRRATVCREGEAEFTRRMFKILCQIYSAHERGQLPTKSCV